MLSRQFLPDLVMDGMAFDYAVRSAAHRKRVELFNRYWDYYNGRHRPPLKVPVGGVNDNVIINLSRKIVNSGIQFLFGPGVRFAIGSDEQDTAAERYLATFWSDNPAVGWSPATFLHSLGQNGGVTGTAFIRLVVGADGIPKLRAIDPAIVDIETNPDDIDEVVAYRLVWKSADDWKRQSYTNMGGMWQIADAVWKAGRWNTVNEAAWEYDFPPIFHAQNLVNANSVWGTSDLEDADLNDAINFTASNINRVLRFHAHPKTIISGLPNTNSSELSTSADGVWRFSSAETKAYNLEMQSDLASSREHRADLSEAFHQVAGVPQLDPAQVNVGALSGFALRILYGPLLAKTAVKQDTYGAMLAQVNRALLILAGHDDVPVRCVWGNPLPASELEMAQHAKLLREIGATAEGSLLAAGYTPEQVKRMVPAEPTQGENYG